MFIRHKGLHAVLDQRLQRWGLPLGQSPPRGAGQATPEQLAIGNLQSCGHLQNGLIDHPDGGCHGKEIRIVGVNFISSRRIGRVLGAFLSECGSPVIFFKPSRRQSVRACPNGLKLLQAGQGKGQTFNTCKAINVGRVSQRIWGNKIALVTE